MEEVDSETGGFDEVDLKGDESVHSENYGTISRDDQTKTGKTQWNCEKCGKNYVQLKSFLVHKCDKRGADKISCPSCSKLISRSNITHHLKTHLLGKNLKCNKCTLTFENEGLKKVHMEKHLKHVCNICGKTFKRPFPFKEHMKTHEYENESSKEDTSGEGLESTKKAEVGKGLFKCKVCGEIYPSITSLKIHMNKDHVKDGIICSECKKIFFTKRGLKDHMENHKKIKENESKNDNNLELDSTNVVEDVVFYTIPDGQPFPEGAIVIDINVE